MISYTKINPIPPRIPVMNLRVLLLSLISNSCVNPSIAHGIKRMIPKSSVVKLYGIGKRFIRIMVAIPLM